jgi:hypothetical protein
LRNMMQVLIIPNVMLSSDNSRKKEVPTKSARRKKNWFEVKRKGNKKVHSKIVPNVQKPAVCC